MTGARRWGEAPRPSGRPGLDPRVRAVIFRLREENPSLGVRAISSRVEAETGIKVSRETVRKLLRSAEQEAKRLRRAPYAAGRAPAGVMGPAGGSVAWAKAALTAMTEEDHERFDRYRGAVVESPGVWWTFR